MKKRRVISIAVAVTLALGIVAFAAQYVSETIRGTVGASNLGIKVEMLEIKNGEEVPVSEEETEVVPSAEISRIAKVKNTGDQDAWVRAKVYLVSGGESIPAADDGYIELGDVNTEDWTWSDGYWYCNEKLAAGKTSPEIFKSVTIKDTAGTAINGADLKVDAEGTQVKNNGSSALEAEGWPTE